MKRFDAGTSGSRKLKGDAATIDILTADPFWRSVLAAALPEGKARPVQSSALREASLLESRRNLVVVAPTNSGKSLVGFLVLIEAVRAGRRAVLLEPLRALAQEMSDRLRELVGKVDWPGDAPAVRVSTGDYRLENETFFDAPPETGELIVATPERLDCILRNAEHVAWSESIGAVVADEAHLIGNDRRGPVLEFVLATLLARKNPPRVALLSATIGEPDRLVKWLVPCDLIKVSHRSPPLKKQVLTLDPDEDANEILVREVGRELSASSCAAALVFTYRRESTAKLARRISEAAANVVGPKGALAYHSGMSSGEKAQIRHAFLTGQSRCVVATTALAMGVNLPATHVFIRDTNFFGHDRLSVTELLQMLGRAGRGANAGIGTVLLRESDGWSPRELIAHLRCERVEPVRSSFELNGHRDHNGEVQERIAEVVAAAINRAGEAGASTHELQVFLARTFGGQAMASRVPEGLRWLQDPQRLLAYTDVQGRQHLSVLGSEAVQAMLPLRFASGFGQVIRDLLDVDSNDRLLSEWTPLDHLILCGLLIDRAPSLRRFSESLAERVDAWIEGRPNPDKSMFFREWIAGSRGASKADLLLGSLGVPSGTFSTGQSSERARQLAYQAVFNAAILDERCRGETPDELQRRWNLGRDVSFDGIDEGWRDTMIWLLTGIARIADLRCFYFHLREHCDASVERVRRVKRLLLRLRQQALETRELLTYCSPLGPMLLGLRSTLRNSVGPLPGAGTLKKLEAAGATELSVVARMDEDDLIRLGVRRDFARKIRRYLHQRLA